MIRTLSTQTAVSVLTYDELRATFEPNEVMTFAELSAALRGFQIHVASPPGKRFIAWCRLPQGRVTTEGDSPSAAVWALLERIGSDAASGGKNG